MLTCEMFDTGCPPCERIEDCREAGRELCRPWDEDDLGCYEYHQRKDNELLEDMEDE